jgi:hypothetical protein
LNWSLVADVLGVAAFVFVVIRSGFHRVKWIFRDAYVLSRLEVIGGQLEAWFVLNNPGPQYQSLYQVSFRITSVPPLRWQSALFVPTYAEDALTIVPPGATIKKVTTRLIILDGISASPGGTDANGVSIPDQAWRRQEEDVARQLLAVKCPIVAELSTSEGKVLLEGRTGIGQPIATERFDLRRRIARIF